MCKTLPSLQLSFTESSLVSLHLCPPKLSPKLFFLSCSRDTQIPSQIMCGEFNRSEWDPRLIQQQRESYSQNAVSVYSARDGTRWCFPETRDHNRHNETARESSPWHFPLRSLVYNVMTDTCFFLYFLIMRMDVNQTTVTRHGTSQVIDSLHLKDYCLS